MIIVGFLRWCVRQKWIPANPLQDVRIGKPPFRPKFAPSLEQIDAILATSPGNLMPVFATLAFTGMRSGELQLLKVGDVDLVGGWIKVQSLKAKLTRIRPVRKVPIHRRLKPILEGQIRTRTSKAEEPLFIADRSQGDNSPRPIYTSHLTDRLKPIATTLAIPVGNKNDGMVVHSFRHAFETIAVNSGVPQRVVDAWLGHTGDRSMGSVYYRLLDTDSQRFMDQVCF